MKQLPGDIVLVEGNNELNVQMTPTIADEITFQSLSYPVYPCYQGRAVAEAILYIPASICPAGSALTIGIYIPRDSDALPLYNPARPELDYSRDWKLLAESIPGEDLVSNP